MRSVNTFGYSMKLRSMISFVSVVIALFHLPLSADPAQPPLKAVADGTVFGDVGQTLSFDGSGMFECPDYGTITEYRWVLPPQAYCVEGDTASQLACKFSPSGTYAVELQVKCSHGAWNAEHLSYPDENRFVYSVTVQQAAGPWYVSPDGSDADSGRSWEHAFCTIQTAIDSASDGDAVLIKSGTAGNPVIYDEQLDLKGKTLTIQSDDPNTWHAAEHTLIDAGLRGAAVLYRGNEAGQLRGFTITGGAPAGDGLALRLTLDDGTGFAAADDSGKGRNGSLVFSGDPNWTTGRIDGALEFDGDGYIEIGGYKGITGGSSRTCSAWIKTTAPGEIAAWGLPSERKKWVFRVNEAGVLRTEISNGYIIGTTLVNDGRWHHVAVVLEDDGSPDISEAQLYVDGRPDTISADMLACPVNTSDAQNVSIGVFKTDLTRFFQGLMDDVRIYSRALSAEEIDEMAGPRVPAVLIPLDSDADDISGNGYHGVEQGDPSYSDGALVLDGVDDCVLLPAGIINPAAGPFSAFARVRGGAGNVGIISQADDATGVGRYWLGIVNGELWTALRTSGQWGLTYAGSAWDSTDWHHVGVVWDGNRRHLYRDGVEVAADASAIGSLEACTGALYIGTNKTATPGYFWPGEIDAVRIFTRALTADEAAELSGTECLRGHWTFDGNLNDSSTNDPHSGVWNGTSGYGEGYYGQAVAFDGSSYVEITDYTGVSGSQARTSAAWINIGDLTSAGAIISWGANDPGAGNKWLFRVEKSPASNRYRFGVETWGGYSVWSDYILHPLRWYHVAACLDGAALHDIQLYADGTEITYYNRTAANITLQTAQEESVHIGATCVDVNNSMSEYFKGRIDEARVFSRALTISEIRELADSKPRLAAHWKLDGDFNDSAANHHGTGINNPNWTKGISGGAVSLDGATQYVRIPHHLQLKPQLPLTLSAWIYLQESGTSGLILQTDDRNTTYSGACLRLKSDGSDTIALGYGDGGPNSWVSLCNKTGMTVLQPGRWYNVVGVIRGPLDMSIYINGVDDGGAYSGIGSGILHYTEHDIMIGSQDGLGAFFKGGIDDVRIYNYALDKGDVQNLYQTRFADGGGVSGHKASPVLEQCIIEGNTSQANGGGVSGIDGSLWNCLFIQNASEGFGGAVCGSGAEIRNCTFAENAAVSGGALSSCSGQILNSIVWGNTPNQSVNSSSISFSCIQGWTQGGTGNISANPLFRNPAEKNYRLLLSSPCIDAGDPTSDFSHEPLPNGGRVNLGAYGNTADAATTEDGREHWDTDGDGIPDWWEVHYGLDPHDPADAQEDPGKSDPDGDGFSNLCEYLHDADPAEHDSEMSAASIHVQPSGLTIQQAIDCAFDGDTIIAAPGTYTGHGNRDIDFRGKAIIVRSADGPDTCIIDCQGTAEEPHRGFYFHSGEGTDSVLSGFTIRNGYAPDAPWGLTQYSTGGAIFIHGTPQDTCSPTIRDCVIQDNFSAFWGGGINGRNSHAVIEDCVFLNNRATDTGGGVYMIVSDYTIRNCHFIENEAVGGSGGALWAQGSISTIENCVIERNIAKRNGGGFKFNSDTYPLPGQAAIIRGCRFYGNVTETFEMGSQGGGALDFSLPTADVINCVFVGNVSNNFGGAMRGRAGASVTVVNCSFSDNAAVNGSSISVVEQYSTGFDLYNSIIWNTNCLAVPEVFIERGWLDVYNCDITGGENSVSLGDPNSSYLNWSDATNITSDPLFTRKPSFGPDALWGTADDDYGDLRLYNTCSPCINAGDDNRLPADVEEDIDGNPRYVDSNSLPPASVVDMGAYEFQNFDQNQPPYAADDPGVCDDPIPCPAAPIIIYVLENDCDPDGDYLAVDPNLQSPAHGTALVSADRLRVTYTPDAAFSGIDSFRYHVSDGNSVSNWATVTITVQPPAEHDPVAVPDTAVAGKGTPIVIDVLENDFDPDQDAITIKDILSGPSNGTAEITPDGRIRYTSYIADGDEDSFTYRIQDSTGRMAQATVTVRILAVDAGPNQTIRLPNNQVALKAEVYGAAANAAVSWEATGRPVGAAVTFGSVTSPDTTAVFSLPGTYILQIEVNSDGLSVNDSAMITVQPNATGGNRPPQVQVWAEPVAMTLPDNTTALNWVISDDGVSNGGLSQYWEVVTGPITGDVSFGAYTPQSRTTQASFSTDGVYILRLTVSDGIGDTTESVLVHVNPDPIFNGNTPPLVNAGDDQTVILTPWRIFSLDYSAAAVTDDPTQTLRYHWSIVESASFDEEGNEQDDKGGIAIDHATELNPLLTFFNPGTYTLKLEASDGQFIACDEVVFILKANYAPTDAIQVDAGPDQIITLPASAFLNGASVTDANGPLQSLEGLSIAWTKIGGPGEVLFYREGEIDNHTLNPEAMFAKAGNYVLELKVSSEHSILTDQITIKAYPGARLAATSHSSFFINEYGRVWAAGSNCYGQLGNGTAAFVEDEGDYDPIGSGEWYGHHSYSPVLAGEQGGDILSNICSLGGGWSSAYALDYNGNVWSWGNNTFGQLGIGRENLSISHSVTEPRRIHKGLQPSQGDTLDNIAAISTSILSEHTLAADRNGGVWSWGYNYEGTLGVGYYDPDFYSTKGRQTPYSALGMSVIEPRPVPVGSPSTILELYLKFDNYAGNKDYSGNNRVIEEIVSGYGGTGNAGLSGYEYTFIDPEFEYDYHDGSYYFSGADNLIVGPNYFGIAGDHPRSISFWIKKAQSFIDRQYQCNGTILSWGRTDEAGGLWEIRAESGQIALYADSSHCMKTDERIDPNFWNHVVVVLPEGATRLTQAKIYMAREGDPDCLPASVTVSGEQDINTGQGNKCLIGKSQIDDPDFNPNKYYTGLLDEVQIYATALSQKEIDHLQRYPYYTAPLRNIVAVSAGMCHSLALEKREENSNCQGRVYSWGEDYYCPSYSGDYWFYRYNGKLGVGDIPDKSNPVWNRHLPAGVKTGEQGHSSGYLSNIIAISAGQNHSMALEKYTEDLYDEYSGRVLTWGWDSIGFRREFNWNSDYPFFEKDDGVYYLGGRLGRGYTTANDVGVISTVPVYVYGPDSNQDGTHDDTEGYLENIVAIAAGESHSMALDKDGHVWVWGDNTHGQLGTGDEFVLSSGFPVKVKSPTEYKNPDGFLGDFENGRIVAIAAGPWHCLALDEYGDVWGWGASWAIGCGATNQHGTFLPKKIVFGNRVKRISGVSETWYADIQTAIDDANEGDEIVVYPGVYAGFKLKGFTWDSPDSDPNLYIHSWNPDDPNSLTKPVIMPIVVKSKDEYGADITYETGIYIRSNHSMIKGFSISDGDYGIIIRDSDSLISNNVIARNTKGGIYCIGRNGATILNNIIDNNGRYNPYSNGGVYCNNGSNIKIISNLIKRNNTGLNFKYTESAAGILPIQVWNNTIVKNNDGGINLSGYLHLTNEQQPVIRNSIVWGNGLNPNQNLKGVFFNIDYCALEEGQSLPPYLYHKAVINSDGDGFLDIDETHYFPLSPDFLEFEATGSDTDDNPNNCIDEGCSLPDPNITNYWVNYANVDIESKSRISGLKIDLGANEYLSYRIDAGQDKTAGIGEVIRMNDAQVLKDGVPGADISPYFVHWYVVSRPQGSAFIIPAQSEGQINPSWSPDALGEYVFRFVLYDEQGNWADEDTVRVTVRIFVEIDPVSDVVLGYDSSTGEIKTSVNLCGHVRGVNPASAQIVWTVPDNVPIAVGAASLTEAGGAYRSTVPVTFYRPGRYQIRLDVLDLQGYSLAEYSIFIEVHDLPYQADAGQDIMRSWQGTNIVIPLSGRLLPCGIPGESYLWHYVQGPSGGLQLETSTGPSDVESDLENPAATFSKPGIYRLQFAVTHPTIGCVVDDLTVIIDSKEIPLTVYAGANLYGVLTNGTATVQARGSFVYPTDDVTVQWYDRDNNPVAGATAVDSTFTFTQSDDYGYTLRATRDGVTVSDTIKIRIYPQSTNNFVIQTGEYGPILAGEAFSLEEAFVWFDGPAMLSYEWSSDDETNVIFSDSRDGGRTSNILWPNVKFAGGVEKLYTLTLTVKNGDSVIGSARVSIRAVTHITPPADTEAPVLTVTPSLLDERGDGLPWPDPEEAIQKGYVSLGISALDTHSGICTITVHDSCGGGTPVKVQENAFSHTTKQIWILCELNVLNLATGAHTITVTAADHSNNTKMDNSVTFTVARQIPNQTEKPYAMISNLDCRTEDYGKLGTQRMPHEVTEGLYPIRGLACHPVGTQEVQFKFELYDPAALVYPQLDTWSLLNGKYPPNPDYFVQRLRVYGDAEAQGGEGYHRGPIGAVGDAAEPAVFGDLDLTGVNNGTYALLLTVRSRPNDQAAYNYSYAVKQFILNCPLKVGNVKFSQEDVVIPVGGVPLRVVRTYDSFQRDKAGDFGFGWSYSIANMDIQLHEQRSDMAKFTDLFSGGWYDTESVRTGSNYDRNVSLTLPDGNRVTFLFYLEYNDGSLYDAQLPFYIARYQSPDGVTARLETLEEEHLSTMNVWNGQNTASGMSGTGVYSDPAYYEFSGYRLLTDDGTTYTFNRRDIGGNFFSEQAVWVEPKGAPYLSRIDTSTGEKIDLNVAENTLRIGQANEQAGVEHEINGVVTKAIKVDYDQSGRIATIRAPMEQGDSLPTIRYEYDAVGNLRKVRKLTDRTAAEPNDAYETLTYEYEDDAQQLSPADHYITAIKDPRGLQPIRYEYDDAGRLIATIDAKGSRIAIDHDPAGRKETVYDRTDAAKENPTDYFYNARGNVTQAVKYAANVEQSRTLYAYDDSNNPDRPTSVTQYVPNPNDPEQRVAAVTLTSYINHTDAYGEPIKNKVACETVIDPAGNLTKTSYAPDGKVAAVVQGKNAQDVDTYTELTASRNYYTDRNLLYLTGVTTTNPDDSLTWHSISLTYYDNQNRVECSVQIDTDALSFEDLFPGGHLLAMNAIDPAIHPITRYVYDPDVSGSPDQPFSITDASGQTQYFRYNADNRQTESWYHWQDPAGVEPDKFIFTVPALDDQGRIIESRQVVAGDADRTAVISDTLQSRTCYNTIGKVDYAVDQDGIVTKYEYDETGSLVETLVYENVAAFIAHYQLYPADLTGILTISRTLYDTEGRAIVTVGPTAPGDEPVGTETVYDAMGRAAETRRWANVRIDLADLTSSDGTTVVGRKVPQGSLARNAWEGTVGGTLAWTANDGQPLVGSAAMLSCSRTAYDSAGRVWRTYSQDDEGVEVCTAEYVYDIAGRQIFTISLPGTEEEAVTETEYDGARRSAVIDAQQNRTEFVYDAFGRVTTTIYPPTDVDGVDLPQDGDLADDVTYTHAGYDGLGRKVWESVQTLQADPDVDDSTTSDVNLQLRKKFYGYDPAGRLVWVQLPQVQDPENNDAWTSPVYQYYYDDYGNTAGILDPKGRLTIFTYDAHGRQTHTYMPFAIDATQHSNLMNGTTDVYTLLAAASPAFEEKGYDQYGRLGWEKDYKGHYALYAYYDQTNFRVEGVLYGLPGQLMQIAYYDGDPEGSGQLKSSLSVVYDAYGRKTTETMWEDDGTAEGVTRSWHYNYDAEGNIEKIETPQGEVGYHYNAITGQKQFTYTGTGELSAPETLVGYGYDDLGRLKTAQTMYRNGNSVTDELTQYGYTAVGSRDWMKLPNDIYTRYTYNAMHRLTDVVHYAGQPQEGQPLPSIVGSYTYSLKADGMRAGVTEYVNQNRYLAFQYDNLNRLVKEDSYDDAAMNPASDDGYTIQYTYDLVGNRKMRVVTANGQTLTTAYTYDPDTDRLMMETHTGPIAAVPYGDGQRIYAYADGAGGMAWQLPGSNRRIGQFGAFVRGLPSVWNTAIFYALMVLIPVVMLWPVAVRQWSRIKGSTDPTASSDLKLWHRMLCVLLAYIFLVGPETFHRLAQADTQYSQLSTLAWGKGNRIIEYGYDANGSLTSKTTTEGSTVVEAIVYDYNLQNRLAKVTTTPYVDGQAQSSAVTEYRYNPQGIRVGKVVDGAIQTDYLIDPYNHTGYAQVLEETEYDISGSTAIPLSRIQYTIGDDCLSQTRSTWNDVAGVWEANPTQYLLYDGHGSTRQLVSQNQTVQDSYSYDAYGVFLQGSTAAPGVTPPQETSLLYAGEQFDTNSQMYNLRARCYNPLNGLFNRVDTYSGNLSDPQSLHKYLYCHANPVNNVDPTGMWSIGEITLVQKIIAVAIGALAPAIITGYESAKANLGWGQIIANSAIAWALAFGFGVGMIFIGPAICKAIIMSLTQIPGVSIEMAKTALMVVGYGMLAYGMLALWTCDYPLAVKISVTIVIAMSIIVAVYHSGKTGGRLGKQSTRNQNEQIAQELEKRGYRVTHGGGRPPEEYLPGPGGSREGSNYVDITAKHKDTGRIVRINTVDTRADGFTPTTRETEAAASIRSKLPEGEHLILIPKSGGLK